MANSFNFEIFRVERTGGSLVTDHVAGASASVPPPETGGRGVQPTPDEGARLSRQRLWDETARPTRPAPPPGARYTRAGRAASAQLVAVHDMLRAELATVRDLIVQVQKGAHRSARAVRLLSGLARPGRPGRKRLRDPRAL